jgi:general stress protein 26
MRGSIGVLCGFAGLCVGALEGDKLQIAWLSAGLYLRSHLPPFWGELLSGPLSSPQKYLNAAVKTTKNSKYGVLSTVHPHASVASRAMQPCEVKLNTDGNPEIYFGTSKFTRKVAQLQENQDVTFAFVDQSRMSCVTYTGRCERLRPSQHYVYWSYWLSAVFPEGHDESKGSRFTVWVMRPHTINYVNLSKGVASSRYDGRPPEIVLPTALPPSDPMYRPPSETPGWHQSSKFSYYDRDEHLTQWRFRAYEDDKSPEN